MKKAFRRSVLSVVSVLILLIISVFVITGCDESYNTDISLYPQKTLQPNETPTTEQIEKLELLIDDSIAKHYKSADDVCPIYSVQNVGQTTEGDFTTVYLWVMYREYSYDLLSKCFGTEYEELIPTVLTAEWCEDEYILTEYWTPDLSQNVDDQLEKKVVSDFGESLKNPQKYRNDMALACNKKIRAFSASLMENELLKYLNDSLSITYSGKDDFKKVGDIYLCGIDSIQFKGYGEVSSDLEFLKRLCGEERKDVNNRSVFRGAFFDVREVFVEGCRSYFDYSFTDLYQGPMCGCSVTLVIAKSAEYSACIDYIKEEHQKESGHEFVMFSISIAYAGYTDSEKVYSDSIDGVVFVNEEKYPIYRFRSSDEFESFVNSEYSEYYNFNDEKEFEFLSLTSLKSQEWLNDSSSYEKYDYILLYFPVNITGARFLGCTHYNGDTVSVLLGVGDYFSSFKSKPCSEGVFVIYQISKNILTENTVFEFEVDDGQIYAVM